MGCRRIAWHRWRQSGLLLQGEHGSNVQRVIGGDGSIPEGRQEVMEGGWSPLLQRWMKPHIPVAAWLRKLGPSWTLSERTFEHCVSPSPGEKAASRRGQGWAGEHGDRSARAMHPAQVA